jgi:hypothetical protein
MNYQPVREEWLAPSSDRERVSNLVARYPHVSDDEAGEILTFMRDGPHVDVFLLSNDDRLQPNLDAFVTDYRPHLQRAWGEGLAVVSGILALMMAIFLALESFA